VCGTPGAVEQQLLGAAPVGLEPAKLGGLELVARQVEGAQVLERSADALEALGERAAESAEWIHAAGLWADHAERVVEQALVLRLAVGCLPRADQRGALVHLEPVAIDSGGDLLLHVVRKRTKRVCERGAKHALIDALLQRWRELARQREAVRDPVHLVPDELGHTSDGHAVVGKRFDDPRLVHRGDRAPRRVCPEQRELRLMRRRRGLDDHRHRRRSGVSPAREALEAVNDFQVATIGADYTDRQICQLVAEHRWRRRALA